MIAYVLVQQLTQEEVMEAISPYIRRGYRLLGPVQFGSHRKQVGYLATLYRDTEGEEG